MRLVHSTGKRAQGGAIAVIVALSMAVLLGFLGLAVDGGHLYLIKTELQNGADACALAAAYELTDAPAIAPVAFNRAEAAGQAVAQKNKVDFQNGGIASANTTVEFGTSLAAGSPWMTAAAGPAGNSKYVRCTIQQTNIVPYLMQVVGAGNQTVRAAATASLAPSQTNCAVPMALCVKPGGTAANNFGYTVGDWYGLDFSATGGGSQASYTGNFRWIDFDPGSPTPGCSGGGAQELACMMAGSGQCNLPSPITGSCSGSGPSTDPGCVGENGQISSMEQAYNTRFGLYKGSYSATNSPMDFTGYSYRSDTWTLGRDAYGGSVAGMQNFKSARTAFSATQSAYVPGGGYSNSSVAQHQTGADRRLVVVSVVDCTGFTSGQHAPIRGYACMMLLDPYDRVGNNVISKFEFLGLSNQAGSPCASSGVAGNASSEGPLVPTLVQ
ncbi:pilus assembly protein TadG-related protein [Piscinibacter sp. XHJ-5]|uniref:pilus assembly protein TadG-related protein n=1 Tax=Piscinibacter sp. XHJ-5 TaxID=3037797 RepID=UPI0024535208|nr:pilus assembly protein TadG-related protein [Piscinibacter sp. XHJ-5]